MYISAKRVHVVHKLLKNIKSKSLLYNLVRLKTFLTDILLRRTIIYKLHLGAVAFLRLLVNAG